MEISVFIVRALVKLRQLVASHRELQRKDGLDIEMNQLFLGNGISKENGIMQTLGIFLPSAPFFDRIYRIAGI